MSSEVIDVKNNLIKWNGRKYKLVFEKTINGTTGVALTNSIVLTVKEYDRALERGKVIELEDLKSLRDNNKNMNDLLECSYCGAQSEGSVCSNCGKSRGDDVARINGRVVGMK